MLTYVTLINMLFTLYFVNIYSLFEFFWLPSIVSDIGVFSVVITLVVVLLLVLISCIILLVLVILVVIIIM